MLFFLADPAPSQLYTLSLHDALPISTAYYLAGEYEKSIADCAEVLKRNPQHFGALSGLGQIYFKLEDYERSLAWFRRALEVNPNMLGVEINIEGIEELLEEKRRRSI